MPTSRNRRGRRRVPALLVLALLALAAAPAGGAEFAPITDAERALTAAPGDPAAPAVVLFEKGRMKLLEYPRDLYSQLDVEVRIKVLNDRGKELFGEVEIEHGRYLRLSGFKGRTVLPDGREIPVREDAIFVDTTSRSLKRYRTKIAFPAVEPGAILDYKYSLRWDDFLFFEPWYFANEVPTLRSEITYILPPNMAARPWGRQVGGVAIQTRSERQANGTHVTAWADKVPGIPDEPWSFPFADLASRFMLLPTEVAVGGDAVPLLKSWASTCDLARYGYQELREKKGDARRQARDLTAGATGLRAKAEAVYRFVRDEIQHDGFVGVFAGGDDRTIDRVLKERRGSAAELALVLEEMLDAVGAEPRLVWAANRLDGRVDHAAAYPWWFERVLVMVTLDGERIFLDPIDRNLGFGQLAPGFEGMPAILYHPARPEVIERLPAAPPNANAKRAEVRLAVDAEGRLGGAGELTLTGHHAWLDLALRQGDEDPAARWQERLEGTYEGYQVSAVTVADARDERKVTVRWQLAQRDEEVLGDEATLWPSRPIGPHSQQFVLPPEQRRTPVQLPFADLEEVALVLSWPEGWTVESAPDAVAVRNLAGSAEQKIDLDAPGRTLRYSRRLELVHAEFAPGSQYAALRELTTAAEKADAQPLVLAAR